MSIIVQEIEAIAQRVCQDLIEKANKDRRSELLILDEESQVARRKLSLIMAREYVTIKDAAFLLGCSDGHIRNLIDKARKGKTMSPIPYLDLDGVTTFHLKELLEWTKRRKAKSKSKECRSPTL